MKKILFHFLCVSIIVMVTCLVVGANDVFVFNVKTKSTVYRSEFLHKKDGAWYCFNPLFNQDELIPSLVVDSLPNYKCFFKYEKLINGDNVQYIAMIGDEYD